MKEMWTGIHHKTSEINYEIRFTTDSKKEYEILRDACRNILDTDKWRIYEKIMELKAWKNIK